MQTRESRLNHSLKHLVDEFRAGMVAADEYRRRRRVIFTSWNESDITTSPGRSAVTSTPVTPAIAARVFDAPQARASKTRGVVFFTLIVIVGIVAYGFTHRTSTTPAPDAVSPDLKLVTQAAERVLQRNRWETEDIEGFLLFWDRLTPALQQQVRAEPVMRSLRYELEQNIALTANGSDGNDEQTRVLERLQSFAAHLDRAPSP